MHNYLEYYFIGYRRLKTTIHNRANHGRRRRPPTYRALSMELRPRYHTRGVKSSIAHMFTYNDVFLIRLVLRRRPTCTCAISPTMAMAAADTPPPTEHFPRSYGPDTEPIERDFSLLYTTIIQICFLSLVLRRHSSDDMTLHHDNHQFARHATYQLPICINLQHSFHIICNYVIDAFVRIATS